MDKEELKLESEEMNDWKIFTTIVNDKRLGKEIRKLIQNYISLFFIDKVTIGPNSLIVMSGDKMINIEPEEFSNFKQMMRELSGMTLFKFEEEKFNPKNKMAAAIAEKMKKARKKLANVKAAEQGKKKNSKGFLW